MQVPAWGMVVPVKRLVEAKTRLRGAVVDAWHPRLVLAMAVDAVGAVLACPVVLEVLVVTDDPDAAKAMAGLGATVVADPPTTGLDAAGLNAAVVHGAAMLAGPKLRKGGGSQCVYLERSRIGCWAWCCHRLWRRRSPAARTACAACGRP